MGNVVRINVDGVNDIIRLYGAGALVCLERDTDSTFATATEIDTEALVADQTQYEFDDTTGTVSHWYRSRFSNSAGTTFSDYSDGFQAGAPRHYGSIDNLKLTWQGVGDEQDNLLTDFLIAATDGINAELGFDFFRHPAVSGTEVRTFDGRGTSTLFYHQGFNSVTQVRVAPVTGGTYTIVTSTHHLLRSPTQTGGPYLELVLSDIATDSAWYAGYDTVEVTGVFGYTSVPEDVARATEAYALELFRSSRQGGTPTPSAFGFEGTTTQFPSGMPRLTFDTIQRYRARHQPLLVA